MKKEELIAENAKLQDRIATLEVREKRVREEFAIAFDWYEKVVSWEQIFVKVGALIAHNITQSEIRNLSNTVELMQRELDNLIEDDGQRPD